VPIGWLLVFCCGFHPNDLTPPVAGSGKLTAVPGGVSGMAHSFGDFKVCRLTEGEVVIRAFVVFPGGSFSRGTGQGVSATPPENRGGEPKNQYPLFTLRMNPG
jgi:hypothetical protein